MSELEKRYRRSLTYLRRLAKAERKLHYEEGETLEEVMFEVRSFLSDLKLERQIERLQEREDRKSH